MAGLHLADIASRVVSLVEPEVLLERGLAVPNGQAVEGPRDRALWEQSQADDGVEAAERLFVDARWVLGTLGIKNRY